MKDIIIANNNTEFGFHKYEHVYKYPWWFFLVPPFKHTMATTMFGSVYFPKAQYLDLVSGSPSIWLVSVLIHEKVHVKRQIETGGFVWGLKYILSKRFRLQEELLAIKEQMIFSNQNNEKYDIERKAKQFSSAEYFWVANYQEAKSILEQVWSDVKSII